MHLVFSDWLIIALYFVVSAAIGLAYTRKAGQSLADYFVSGRSLPWWLAGTSMVATTFAADTPLVVAGLVAKYGVAGNWLWWNGAFSGVLTVFFFSRLWRRAGVLTDVEFAELRYGGRPAAVLRGFRALYLALPDQPDHHGVGDPRDGHHPRRSASTSIPGRRRIFLFGVTALYSVFAGLWGVIVTDLFQFVFAMGGSILLAVLAVQSVGGLEALTAKAAAHFGSTEAAFGVIPPLDAPWLPLSTLLVWLSVQWWAAWYPGPGAGRRRLRGAADPLRQGRAPRPAGHPLVHHRALRAPALALDPGRVRRGAPLSRARQPGGGLRPGDGGHPALAVQGPAARGLRRGVHEHDQHPPQLGRVVSRQRRVSAVREARREPASPGHGLAARDRRS